MNKRFWIFCLLIRLLIPITVFAAEERGSIRLTMHYGSQVVAGSTVILYTIPDWVDTWEPEELAEAAGDMDLPGVIGKVGSDGCVVFRDLAPGQYLLAQEMAAEGYLPMKPFCVSLPMAVNGELIYQIDAFPKLELEPGGKLPQTGLLIWPAWMLLGTGAVLVGLSIFVGKREE